MWSHCALHTDHSEHLSGKGRVSEKSKGATPENLLLSLPMLCIRSWLCKLLRELSGSFLTQIS